jgi:16S rRNA (uracil1498-N3)-methyltransferase
MHRIFVHHIPQPQNTLHIEGDEAHHALRVKRLRTNETVELLDGSGTTARATLESPDPRRRTITVRVLASHHHPPVRPAVHVYAPAPKGAALEHMIDQLSQAGAASWTPLRTDHSEREPRSLDRLRRVAIESAKQCGRPYLLDIRPPADLAAALRSDALVLVADAAGSSPEAVEADSIAVLIGPEGGWSDAERDRFAASGLRRLKLGPHVMRIETAAVVAAAAMLLPGAR